MINAYNFTKAVVTDLNCIGLVRRGEKSERYRLETRESVGAGFIGLGAI